MIKMSENELIESTDYILNLLKTWGLEELMSNITGMYHFCCKHIIHTLFFTYNHTRLLRYLFCEIHQNNVQNVE